VGGPASGSEESIPSPVSSPKLTVISGNGTVFGLAQQCGGLSALKKLVDRLAEVQG
jgi:hypothetical protein